jgi:ribosomal protein L12E/L44/L45/RPP1/RPP2
VISDGDEGLEAVAAAAAAEKRKEEDKQGAETRRREHRGERTNRLLKL